MVLGKDRVIRGLDDMGERLEEKGRSLHEEGGLRSPAGTAADRAGHAMERGAEYLRTHSLRQELRNQVRSYPMTSMAVAVGSGFLVGRALFGGRGGDGEERERDAESRRRELRRSDGERGRERGGVLRYLGPPVRKALVAGASAYLTRQVQDRVSGRR